MKEYLLDDGYDVSDFVEEDYLYSDLTYKVLGCVYDVYNSLGPAHKEIVYHNALKIGFDHAGINYESEKQVKLIYKGQAVGYYRPDLIVDDKVILELKSVLQMPKVFETQLYYYLRASHYKLGYIINFGADKLDIRKRIYDKARKQK